LLDDYRIAGGTSAPVTITVLPAPVLPELDTPVITGTLALGEVLTVLLATELPDGAELFYQWFRDGVAIPGAQYAAYWVELQDVGTQLSVRVTAALHLAEDKTATSASTATVPKVPATVTLSSSGTQQEFGGTPVTLTASIGTAPFTSGGGTVTFSWADGVREVPVSPLAVAKFPLPSRLPVGTHVFTASFEPIDTRVAGATSGSVTITVVPGVPVLPTLDSPVIAG